MASDEMHKPMREYLESGFAKLRKAFDGGPFKQGPDGGLVPADDVILSVQEAAAMMRVLEVTLPKLGVNV